MRIRLSIVCSQKRSFARPRTDDTNCAEQTAAGMAIGSFPLLLYERHAADSTMLGQAFGEEGTIRGVMRGNGPLSIHSINQLLY